MLKTAFAFLLVFVCFCSCKNKTEKALVTTPSFDSAFSMADKSYDSGNKAEALHIVLEAHSSIPNLTIADQMNYFTYCGGRYNEQKNFDKCIAVADSMLLLLNNEKDSKQISRYLTVAYNAKADALFSKELYNEAYDCYYKAKRLAKENGDSCALRSYAYSLAMVLYKQQRYREAAHNFIEAYNASGACGNDFNIFYFRQELLDNIGLSYGALHEYDSAMLYYNRALDYVTANTGKFERKAGSVYEAPKAIVYGNMAEVYVNKGQYDTAIKLYNKSIGINLQKGYTNGDALIDQTKLADLYFKTSDIPMMKTTLVNIEAELDTIPDQQHATMQWNRLMWKYYEHEKDSVLAYRHLNRYIVQHEAWTAANKALMATDLETRVKGVEKQYEINLLTRDKQQQQVALVIVTVVAFMALAIVILVWRNVKAHKKIEEHIKASEERYRSIFDNSQALICTHNLGGMILDVNYASMDTLGYAREELIGTNVYDLLPRGLQPEFAHNYIPDLKNNSKASGIMSAMGKAGNKVYLLYQNYMVVEEGEEPYVISFSQDITLRIEAERALKKSEEKFRSISANMNLGLMETDQSERIIYANNAFCKMSGYSLDELLRKDAAILLGEENKELNIRIKEVKKLDDNNVYEMRVLNKNGDSRWWLVSTATSYDSKGRFKGSIGIHLDITIQKNLERALRKAKSDVERSAQTKDIFLANMSHEIRTPMNAILGIEHLLSKTPLDDKQKHYLATIQNATNNLLVIINDLLDFSKIEAGKVALERVGFELNTLIENSVVILKYKAAEKSLLINNIYSPDIAPVLIGDPYRINQVLMNLLSNSIKFTEQGSVNVECSVIMEDSISQQIEFRIVDTGIGMSKEFIELLFNKFAQEDESITRKFGGTGLGMSICKELVELMGGVISVESRKNAGTTISFALRFNKGTVKDLPKKEVLNVDKQVFKGKRFLLVEDNEANRLIANTIISNYGAEVVEAENGEIAIEKFREGGFDIILMDVRMPVKDGLDTTRYIRANIDNSIPIIALTASALKEEEERCMLAGMNDFVSKPFNENKLIHVVAEWLGKEVEIAEAPVEEKVETDQLFSLAKLQAIGRGNNKFVKNLMELFIINTPDTLNEMQLAFNGNDWKTLSHLAHRIKPSIHNMGIASLQNDIDMMEELKNAPGDTDQVRHHLNRVVSISEEVITQLKMVLPDYN